MAGAQEPAAPQAVSPRSFRRRSKARRSEYSIRTDALAHRSPHVGRPGGARPDATRHQSRGRLRALPRAGAATGFNDPRTKDIMREVLSSPNDRLRTVAYSFFERTPDPALVPQFLAALDKEVAEFVRPALIRALARSPPIPKCGRRCCAKSAAAKTFSAAR
jgi:hypothetical protein